MALAKEKPIVPYDDAKGHDDGAVPVADKDMPVAPAAKLRLNCSPKATLPRRTAGRMLVALLVTAIKPQF